MRKSLDKVFHGELILDSRQLAQVMVLRKEHIAGIANHIDDPPVARIETAICFYDAWLRRPVEISLHANIGIEDQPMQIAQAHLAVGMYEVRDEESHPRISRPRIRGQQNIIGVHGESPSREVEPERALHTRCQMANQCTPPGLNPTFISAAERANHIFQTLLFPNDWLKRALRYAARLGM